MTRLPRVGVLMAVATPYVVAIWPANAAPQAGRVDFVRDVQPILKAHCVNCHSGKEPAGELDLSTPNAYGANRKLITPGKPDQSVLLRRVLGLDGLARMPMGYAPLSDAKIATLRKWIESGANFRSDATAQHWAYAAPKAATPPKVAGATHPIDRFVFARLRKEGLAPSPRATKETLLRRASLDLTGLPPTVDEVRAFLADARPDAYDRAVDRLLASPHYGEKQARLWLDLARYADSDGYEKDLRRTAWKYRDWVIDAFNRNMPYDRFTVEQIAGDLEPNPTTDDLVATGFHRNTMLNLEGGVDQEEAHFNVVLDRVMTTGSVWLGGTIGCARCHDHKYDPYTMRDFYRMAAFFSNAKIYPRGDKNVGEEKWFEKSMRAPTAEQTRRLTELQARRATAAARLTGARIDSAFEAWRLSVQVPIAWNYNSTAATAKSGAPMAKQPDGSWLATGTAPKSDRYTVILAPASRTIAALEIHALPDDRLPNKGPGRAGNGNFVVNRVELRVNGKDVPLGEAVADFVQQDFAVARGIRGVDGASWAISPQMGREHRLILEVPTPVTVTDADRVEVVVASETKYADHVIGRFLVATSATPSARFDLAPIAVKRAIGNPNAKVVRDYFLATAPALRPERDALAEIDRQIAEVEREIPTALVMEDKPATGPLQTVMHPRGEFLQKGDLVTADVPTFLPGLPKYAPRNRLGLARWLVDRRNPLTARVQVNRMWETLFGRGLVETSEDFGTQGSKPSHPELLDWLAVEFMNRNWDMKAMWRLIVTSETYKQSSNATAKLIARDPQNVLLARGPRFRLEAEAIRDNALAAAGILDRKVGGPSVMPYQPDGVWDTPYNGDQWRQSMAGDAFRRGLYTFWKRTSPYPSFIAFDATSREVCTVRRTRTNTPLQALALLNDDAIFVAAKGLAKRMMAAPTPDARVRLGFVACTGRYPTSAETARLKALAQSVRSKYVRDGDGAKRLAGDPDAAAWTMVANVLLNLDETITKS